VELSASLQVRWVKFVVVAQRLGEKFAAGGYRLPRVLRDWTCVQREARVMVVSRMYPLVIGSLVLSVASSVAQEKKIKRSDLPAAVEKTVSAQSQRATIRGFSEERENGQMYYEAEMTVDGHSKDLLVDNSGAIVEVEEQVAMDSLPAPVKEGLQTKAGKGKLVKVESITKHEKLVAYEAQVVTGGKKSEVQVGPDGKPLDHEE